MDRWLRLLFISIYIVLAAIQLKLLHSIYIDREQQLQRDISTRVQSVKSAIETHEINRHKEIFNRYKTENLCGDSYRDKPLELTFVIAPTDSFNNLEDLNDIIYGKLRRQAISSSRFLVEQLPLDTSFIDSVCNHAFTGLQTTIESNYQLLSADSCQPSGNTMFPVILFDDYRLYFPHCLTFTFTGVQSALLHDILLLAIGTLITMLILLFATRYAYLTMQRYRKLAHEKSAFISHLAHEIRTPLTSISVAAQALQDERIVKLNEPAFRFAQTISNESEKLNRQLENVLTSGAAESNFLLLKLSRENVNHLLQKIADLFKMKIHDAGGTLICDFSASHATSMVDATHFGNVIYNLIDNAIKYSDPSHIQVTVETTNVNGQLNINIRDEGKGIAQGELESIFRLFYRNESGSGGFGVGLHYARAILKYHNGTIDVESKLNRGTIFTIRIPTT